MDLARCVPIVDEQRKLYIHASSDAQLKAQLSPKFKTVDLSIAF
jgi:hypothetical protein